MYIAGFLGGFEWLIILFVFLLPVSALISIVRNKFEGNNKLLWVIIVFFILAGCSSQKSEDNGIIEINITNALANKQDMQLSKLVEKVEILVLESNIDCFMQAPYNMHFFGEKYILFHDNRKNQFFLFNRQGKFINKIGRSGKGPGEYNLGCKATVSKDESRIIVSDRLATKVIVYNLKGEVIVQKNLIEYFPSKYFEEMYCFYENQIVFLTGRPYQQVEGYSNLLLFDLDLNKIGEVLPRPNDDNLTCLNLQHKAAFVNRDGTFCWEMYKDTIYQFYPDGKSVPRYHFVVDKNNLTKEVMHNREWSLKIYDYTFPFFVNFIPGYLYVSNSGGKSGGLVLYNLKKQEAFSTKIENNMFGIGIGLNRYYPDQNICAYQYRWGDYAEYHDLDEIRRMDVKIPEIRDQLLEYAENPSEDLGPVVILMHMR